MTWGLAVHESLLQRELSTREHAPLPYTHRCDDVMWSAASSSCFSGFSTMTGCILDLRVRINHVCLQQILSGCLIKVAGKATRTYLTLVSFSQHHNSHKTSWPHSLGDFENEHPSSPGRTEHGWVPPKTQHRELLLFGLSVNSLKISTYRELAFQIKTSMNFSVEIGFMMIFS